MSDQEFLHSAIHGSLLAVISKPHRGYWALLVAAWAWAIWSCAEYWRGNPNYSYGWIVPVLSLTYAARRLTLAKSENIARPTLAVPIWVVVFIGIVAAAIIFGLEFAREQVLHPIIVIWAIAFVPITLTLLACWLAGGRNLARAELFPILFFLTAVPWPPRFEQPITAGLMQAVAAATTGLLHWFGIPAQTAGGANRVAYYDLLLEKNVSANTTKAKELVAKYSDRLEFRVTAALAFLREHDAAAALAQFQGPPIEWAKTPPSWRAVYAAALRGNERDTAAREIIATIPMDKLSSEERALIEAK
jgi:hypothetical protein